MKPPLSALMLAVALGAMAATPQRVLDIGAGVTTKNSSDPSGAVRVGSFVFFAATDPAHGRELWVMDTAGRNAHLLRDINPGTRSASPAQLVSDGTRLYFVADDGIHGKEPWVSDGTEAGTQLAADVNPGAPSSDPTSLTAGFGTLAFAADDGVHGASEMFRYSPGGGLTGPFESCPGHGAGHAFLPAISSTHLYFGAQGCSPALSLYVTPLTGTGAPTIVSGLSGVNAISEILSVGTGVFVAADTDGSGPRVHWVPSGGAAVAPVVASTTETVDGAQGLIAAPGAAGSVLCTGHKTSTPGTYHLFSLSPSQAVALANFGATTPAAALRAVGTTLYLAIPTPNATLALYRYPLPSGPATPVTDLGDAGVDPSDLVPASAPWLYFRASDPVEGRELFRTNGTTVERVTTTPGSLAPSNLATWDELASFSDPRVGETELAVATPDAGVRAVDLSPGTSGASPGGVAALPDRVVLAATSAASGREPWVSDGTSSGTRLLLDVAGGAASSNPSAGTVDGGTACLLASGTSSVTPDLWCTNGTVAATRLVLASDGTSVTPPLLVGSEVWWTHSTGATGLEPIHVNVQTTAATTVEVSPGTVGSSPTQLTAVGGAVIFSAFTPTAGVEPWRASSTGSTAAELADFINGPPSSSPELFAAGPDLAFVNATALVADGGDERQLWATDGAAGSLFQVATSAVGGSEFTPLGGNVLFAASTPETGRELFRYVPGSRSAELVEDLAQGRASASPADLTSWKGAVYFSADDGNGRELWRSDGTAAGTAMVARLRSGRPGSQPADLTPTPDGLFFSADDGVSGRELWRTDGTAAGTVRLSDLSADGGSSSPDLAPLPSMAVLGRTLVFAATDETGRRELYAVSTDPTPPVITPTLSGPQSGGWYTGDVHLTFAVSDPETAVQTSGCDPADVTEDTAGVTFTCTATSAGGSATSSVVIRRDATAPVLTCPLDAIVRRGTPIPDGGVTVSDLDPAPVVTSTPAVGTPLQATTSVRVTATDEAGNPSSCDYTLTVERSPYDFGCSAGGSAPLTWGAIVIAAAIIGRRRSAVRVIAVAVAVLASGAQAGRLTLLVPAAKAGQDVSSALAESVTGYEQAELARVNVYRVVGAKDLAAMLGAERQREMVGACSSEQSTSCMAELAGAMNAERILASDLSKVGGSLLLNISLIDQSTASVIATTGRRVPANAPDALLDEVRGAIKELVSQDARSGYVDPERRFNGASVGVRFDSDVLNAGFSPGITGAWDTRWVGASATVLLRPAGVGARLEGRFFPAILGSVRPHVALGTTLLSAGASLRGGVGLTARFEPVAVFADAAYEWYPAPVAGYFGTAVVVGAGVSWVF